PLDPLLADLNDIKTAVSEAITNSIIHGYNSEPHHEVSLLCRYENKTIYIEIKDDGIGIQNLKQAMEPMYTSKPEEERSGLGFTFMENMMDTLHVNSNEGFGTIVYMTKTLSGI
ncbi:MAG: anti-sigma F factor, partial [Defluviitaleaceae bacterium]|nr:anti-sigma F factor [Defluviitaleaceae bacterium]